MSIVGITGSDGTPIVGVVVTGGLPKAAVQSLIDQAIDGLGAGGASLSDDTPADLGSASAGVGTEASRSDHVHAMPSAADVGADPSGTAAGALSTHVAASDPHGDRSYTDTALAGKVPTTRTVNGHALSGDVTVTKGDVGLGNVDNTSDADKPVSTATQAALDAKVTGDGITDIVALTQAEYDGLTPDATTLYVVTD